ncbi:MAG TPA: metal ABC transporter permease [Candidatus Saccharimonadales bacterium]|nr:metal ABC transporter permease [Candidatus Saccharimonadales bacterium]
MLEIFTYSFMVRAFIAGIAIGVVAPLIGTFLVAKRYALIADSLAHISLAGVAAGVLIGINPILSALVVAAAAAVLIEKLRAGGRLSGELALAMFLSSGLAIAVVLIGLAQKVNIDLFSFLFGSIATVQPIDLMLIVPMALGIVALSILLYKELAYVSFDDEQARVSGLPTKALNQALVFFAAITVVVSLRIVGGLLIGALMVIPVATAMQLARSLKQTIFFAITFGLAAVITGLFAAFYLSLAAGGTIVIVALGLFAIALLWRKTMTSAS